MTPAFSFVHAAESYDIGFVSLQRDDRYDRFGAHPGDRRKLRGFYPPGRPDAGAALGILDARPLARTLKTKLALKTVTARNTDSAIAAVENFIQSGIGFVLLDLPAEQLAAVVKATEQAPVMLINVSVPDDRFRNRDCAPHLLHTAPSDAMLMDALAQYLLFKKWTEILLLQGPQPADALRVSALRRAAKRYGLKIVEERKFLLSNDPRSRETNRIGLLTANIDFDIAFIADIDRNFAYQVPYRMQIPRPVAGDAGLRPTAWSWTWTRHGAPQLNSRFEGAHKRRMTGADWSAWFAVKAITEAILRTQSADFEKLSAYITAADARFDGVKGGGYSFRPWSGQLRQNVLLTGAEWVAATPPLDAFLHAKNNLDTLGYDAPESTCTAR